MQSAEQWGALSSRLGIRLGTRHSGSRHSLGRIGRGHTENGKSGKKEITSAHFFTRKKEGGYTGFFYAPSFRPFFFFLACLCILPGGGLPVDCWILLNIYLSINVVIFVNEKSVILQSWLKKSVPTLGKFMVDNKTKLKTDGLF